MSADQSNGAHYVILLVRKSTKFLDDAIRVTISKRNDTQDLTNSDRSLSENVTLSMMDSKAGEKRVELNRNPSMRRRTAHREEAPYPQLFAAS
jgi:hypothetical protein